MALPTYPNTISGKYLTVNIVVGSVSTPVAGAFDWNANLQVQELDATTGLTGGYEASDFGTAVVQVSFDLIQNIASGVFYAVSAGQAVYLRLFRSGGDTKPAFDIPVFNIFSAATKISVKDRITIAVSGKSSGSFTFYDPGAT